MKLTKLTNPISSSRRRAAFAGRRAGADWLAADAKTILHRPPLALDALGQVGGQRAVFGALRAQ